MFTKHIKQSKKITALLLILVLMMSIVSACSNDNQIDTGNNAEIENQENDKQDKEATRTIKDMAGREVEVPSKINKVFTTSPVGTIALYSIDSTKIVGLNKEVSPAETKYLDEDFQKLPILGTYKNSTDGNEEEILKANPDIILSMGDVDERWIGEADESQERLGVPFLMVDSSLENLDETYKFLGDLLGEEERAKELADYCKETIDNSKKLASEISEKDRVTVYYADGEEGTVTNVVGSIHAEAIDLIGAKNAAEVEVEKFSGGVDVSMEQILNWNPDKIIANKDIDGKDGTYELITDGDKWGTIDAVKNGEVYAIPNEPFNWFDKPASVNRILGVRWLGNIIYPEVFDIDIKQETKNFYKMFYHYDLTDEEVEDILENSIKK